MTQPTPITVVVKIKYGEHAALKELLQNLGRHVTKQTQLRIKETGTYFGRLVILDNDPHYPPLLVFEATFDGPLDSYLDDLIRMGPGVDQVFGKCDGYPPQGISDPAAFKGFMKSNNRPINTFYAAYKQITLKGAKANLALRERIQTELLDPLDKSGKLVRMSPAEVRKAIQDFVREQKPPIGAGKIPFLTIFDKLIVRLRPPAGSPLPMGKGWRQYLADFSKVHNIPKAVQWFLENAFPKITRFLLFPYLFFLRRKERADAAAYVPPPPVQNEALNQQFQAIENQITQNQMTHVVEVKPGKLRYWTLSGVLWAINFLARHALTAGRLADVATVHFARWLYIDDHQRLLFMSNFDGPWSAYVGDFVDRTSGYLTGIWSNTFNFPPTRDLVLDGAQDIDGFGWFLRVNQLPTEFFYSAFKDDTVVSIVSTTQIAQDLNTRLGDRNLGAWLRRF
ncbi:MAG TPA: hypothetical protein VEZ11_05445 [Thermoanaerobaculia bacterium]|nr:hypothetical protein [Thermoanaerobaculia bacterium]